MKRFGLVGGMSPESTIEYYRIVNREYNSLLGAHHSSNLVLSSVDFQGIVLAMHRGDWKQVENTIVVALQDLEKAGVDFALICCNSAHKVFDAVAKKSPLPLLHILEPVGELLQTKKITRVGIIGNSFTMQGGFYHDYLLNRFDIVGMSPNLSHQAGIHHIIYKELCYGSIKAESKKYMIDVIDALRADGAEAVILGCTELMLLISDGDASLPIFDSTTLHAQAAVHYIVNGVIPSCYRDEEQGMVEPIF